MTTRSTRMYSGCDANSPTFPTPESASKLCPAWVTDCRSNPFNQSDALPLGMGDQRPIGIFDSGVGGLTVLKEIRERLPLEPTIYVADLLHFPYGPRYQDEVRGFAIVEAGEADSPRAERVLRENLADIVSLGADTLVLGCTHYPLLKPAIERV